MRRVALRGEEIDRLWFVILLAIRGRSDNKFVESVKDHTGECRYKVNNNGERKYSSSECLSFCIPIKPKQLDGRKQIHLTHDSFQYC